MVFARDGEVVTPGEPICVEEEFSAGENVKLHGDGVLASVISGVVHYDHSRRVVSVKPLKQVEDVKVGDQVLAQVREVQEKIAIATIISANGSALKHPRTGVIIPGKGVRIEDMRQHLGVGDLVVASIVTDFMGVIGLSIWRQDLGVVLGICQRCSGVLLRSRRVLLCARCGEEQKRKIAPYYGNLERLASMMR